VKEYNIALEKKTVTSGELKIALISDLHLGSNSHLDQIAAMVEKINEANPDVVLVAGDIFNGSYDNLEDPEKYADTLHKMDIRQGVYAIYGDYDVKERLMVGYPITPPSKALRDSRMTEFMKSAGFTMLEDQTVYVNGVQIVGRLDESHPGDGKTKRQSVSHLIRSLDTKMPVLMLQHEPTGLENLASSGADLTLAGGTHNGQFLPLNLIWHFMSENSYGLKRLHGAYSMTTCGIGYTGPPIRVATHSEVSIINLSY
jgi:predicted MPP superfamily phosphohydrolase